MLTNRHILNAASGMCLASIASPGYAVMHRCSSIDGPQLWLRTPSLQQGYVLQNIDTGWFLRCGCTGMLFFVFAVLVNFLRVEALSFWYQV